MSVQARRQAERRARWQQIVDAAQEAFFEKGYHRTTLDDIEEASDLTRGAIYYYFSGKDEIYVSVLEVGLRLLRDELRWVVRGETGPPSELLTCLADTYCDFYLRHKGYYRILQDYFFGSGAQSDLGQELVSEINRLCLECLQVVVDVLKRGVEEHAIECADPFLEAVLIWSALTGAMQLTEENPRAAFLGIPWEDMKARVKASVLDRLSLLSG